MAANQFLRDFRRDFQIKKSTAHRKAVMERKEKARHEQMKVNLFEIKQDRSHGKEVSHTRLVALVNQVKSNGMVRLYKKSELHKLCSSYGCHYLAKWNKTKSANELCRAIVSQDACHALSPNNLHVCDRSATRIDK